MKPSGLGLLFVGNFVVVVVTDWILLLKTVLFIFCISS